jgi:hypothetical protein
VNFSNYGDNLSLLAPGAFADNDCHEGIYLPLPPVASLFDGNQCIRSFVEPNARYAYLRGTSFAAPEVAGAAALIWAARPDLKNFEIATLLQHGADQLNGAGWNSSTGWGVLDVARSIELATGQSAADRIDLAVKTNPASAGAGLKVTETAGLTWGDGTAVGEAGVACAATVEGAPLTPLVQSISNGLVTCIWRTPTSAAGRSLVGTIGATEPHSGLTASKPFVTRLTDVTAPTVHARASSGRWGQHVALHFVTHDAVGVVSVRARVFRGKTVVATRLGKASPLGWTAPSAPKVQSFRFCVTASDQAGHTSAPSCAPIRLR